MVLPFAFASQYSCPSATTKTVLSLRLVTTERELRRNYSAQVTKVCNSSFSGFILRSRLTGALCIYGTRSFFYRSTNRTNFPVSIDLSSRSRTAAHASYYFSAQSKQTELKTNIQFRAFVRNNNDNFTTYHHSLPTREDWGLRSEKRQLVSHCTVAYLVSSLSRHVSPLAGCLRGLAFRLLYKVRLLYFYVDTLESLSPGKLEATIGPLRH